jgi:hypothetical protein
LNVILENVIIISSSQNVITLLHWLLKFE